MSERASERDNYLIQPDDYIALGNRQSQIGNDLGALAAYDFPKGTLRERAVCLTPNYAKAYNYRGSFKFARLGDIQGAIRQSRRYANGRSRSIPTWLRLITCAACSSAMRRSTIWWGRQAIWQLHWVSIPRL